MTPERVPKWFLRAPAALPPRAPGWLDPDEAARMLAEYERRNWIAAPVIRAVFSQLAGFRYDGSESARRRLAEVLPLVAFRPRT